MDWKAKFRWERNCWVVDPEELNTQYIISFTIEKHVVKRIAAQLSSSIKTISKSRNWNCLIICNKRCEDKKISKEKGLAFGSKWLISVECVHEGETFSALSAPAFHVAISNYYYCHQVASVCFVSGSVLNFFIGHYNSLEEKILNWSGVIDEFNISTR